MELVIANWAAEARAWKLAHEGTPTILIYLGFFGDTGIQDISPAIHSPNHWRDLMLDHMKGIFP